LIIHLPADQIEGQDGGQIEKALHNYFSYRRTEWMWRPLETFLYDWRPIWRRCRLMTEVSQTPVIVRAG
jgi:hypothetical protein